MWEFEIFESGMEMTTIDWPESPEIGAVIGDMRIVAILEIDAESQTAKVAIEFA